MNVRRDVRGRLAGWRAAMLRVTPATLLVRGTVFACTFAALLLAYPAAVLVSALGPLAVVALVPAVAPRTRFVTIALLLAVFGWLAATTRYGEPVGLPRLVALSCLLYLAHTTAALAAVLPYDTVVAPTVLVRWLTRAAVVLAVSGVFAVVTAAAADAVAGRAYLVASIAGLLLVAALAALLATLRRR
jgi:hypothetical protein